jgi:bacterioferritin
MCRGEHGGDSEGWASHSHFNTPKVPTSPDAQRKSVRQADCVQSYSEIVQWLGNDDSTTRKIIEDLLKMEEEHAEDLKSLLEKVS